MKKKTNAKKLNFGKKVILLLGPGLNRRIIGGSVIDFSMADPCDTIIICTRSTVPGVCPTTKCTTVPTDACTR